MVKGNGFQLRRDREEAAGAFAASRWQPVDHGLLGVPPVRLASKSI
ncbi:hypothetical protein [Streptosporangium sp. NPDC001681]